MRGLCPSNKLAVGKSSKAEDEGDTANHTARLQQVFFLYLFGRPWHHCRRRHWQQSGDLERHGACLGFLPVPNFGGGWWNGKVNRPNKRDLQLNRESWECGENRSKLVVCAHVLDRGQ